MPRPFLVVDRVDTPEGPLELRQRGDSEFLILHAGRVLMSSAIHRTEAEVAVLGCRGLESAERPRVLIGGLGLGFTLRAALDVLPKRAEVVVAELNPRVVDWCKGPVAPVIGHALDDRRVEVVVGDVIAVARAAAKQPFDAIVIDLYEGPKELPKGKPDLLYGKSACEAVRDALVLGGTYAVWSEEPYGPFEGRLKSLGFQVERVRAGRGGPRHAVYLAKKKRVRD
ncbi:MAG: hypothetical protein U0230_24740 [Polyangiales bacterium]